MSGEATWYVVQTDDAGDTTLCDAPSNSAAPHTPVTARTATSPSRSPPRRRTTAASGDCSLPVVVTWTESNVYKNPLMMFWSPRPRRTSTTGPPPSSRTCFWRVHRLLRLRLRLLPGPYFGTVAYDGSETGTTEFDNASGMLTWTFEDTYEETARTYFEYCDYIDYWDAYDNWDAPAGTSGIDCEGEVVDVWEVELTAGDMFLASVDTVAADSAFDPWMYVNGPDSCFTATADDSFDCTFEPVATVPLDRLRGWRRRNLRGRGRIVRFLHRRIRRVRTDTALGQVAGG